MQLQVCFELLSNTTIKRKGLHKKEKRQDWDHKAYHDAPSAI